MERPPEKRRRPGTQFTLAQLLVLVVVIAVAGAIIIPGQAWQNINSNERSASARLKTLGTAQADFRSNDRDENQINDFWVRDVAGLYGIVGGDGRPIRLVEISMARADGTAANPWYPSVPGPALPTVGYYYAALQEWTDGDGTLHAYDGGTGSHTSKFGYIVYPDVHGKTGRLLFILSEENTMFKFDRPEVIRGGPTPPAMAFPWDDISSGWDGPMD